ncbi:MAG: TlpA family protein disulfide reductase [Bryobacterales bacterium]|nr:TlpA family protein disulfide reductase [Bryobacterales bacterium]
MIKRAFLLLAGAAALLRADLVADVRGAIAQGRFADGEAMIKAAEKVHGGVPSPESILALSWLGRGAQAAKRWDDAERYAKATRALVEAQLKQRPLDAEPQLPLALGASIEVIGHTFAGRGQRSEGVAYLQGELKKWYATSIRTRTQKNLHLLSLVGQPAPALETPVLAKAKGKPVLLFFWAHWCVDCKAQFPILARLQQEYSPKGLVMVGPTQRYGYVAGGEDAPPEREAKYIAEVRKSFYGDLKMETPLSEENFKRYGCSTTPTLVLVDRAGKVQLYNPGRMSYEQLQPALAALVN